MLAMTTRRKLVSDREFKDRLFRSWMMLQLREGGTLSQEWLGQEVSKKLRLKEPLTQSAVSRWFNGVVPKNLKTIVAIAELLNVDPGWLAFGSASRAPSPADPLSATEYLPQPED